RKPTWESLNGRMTGRRVLVVLVVGLVSAAYLSWTAASNWSALAEYSWRFDLAPLAGAGVAYAVAFAAGVVSWNLILRRVGFHGDLFGNARVYCLSALMKHLPGGLWYVLGRVYLYEQRGITRTITVQSTAYE